MNLMRPVTLRTHLAVKLTAMRIAKGAFALPLILLMCIGIKALAAEPSLLVDAHVWTRHPDGSSPSRSAETSAHQEAPAARIEPGADAAQALILLVSQ
ncbi:hypothetical protein [Neorhizobium tomejilense]|uniref:hypothetical protein n=1 Tax=Neorhizobium tomejilense TaxID=2093828 RepID=UPI000CF97CB2|nr:hypothetical protein [Neorhizobium tomejilense]